MNFTSTSNKDTKSNFKDCLLNPMPDKHSLWFPDNIKQLPESFFENIHKLSFEEISITVLNNLLGKDIPETDLKKIITESFNFEIPLVSCCNNIHILELFHGPTFTFKDVGARFMSRILKYYYPDNNTKFDIIVSTSGDTGSAVADAFKDLENVKVHIIYPKDLISDIQEKQLTTYGKNVFAYQLEGNFDECQNLVKKTLKDNELTNRMLFFPANSINIARLIPQCLYYFWAYAQFTERKINKKVNICVPSGNLGNLSGGILAYKLGLPINHFIGATNVNNTFERYIKEDNFDLDKITRAIPTISNAMDISIPNNLKRLQYVFNNSNDEMAKVISSYSCSDKETLEDIKEFWDKYKYPLDPHTAVGYNGVKKFILENNKSEDEFIILSTAHPAKFYKTMDNTNVPYKFPSKLKEILNLKGKKEILKNDYSKWKELLIKNSYENVTFIGMPFAGKSFMGEYLSEKFGYNLIDVDRLIEKNYGDTIDKILNNIGVEEFKKLEENTILSLKLDNKTVISPGGSVIYTEKGMEFLRRHSKIIYLEQSLDLLKERMDYFNKTSPVGRGIVLKENETYEDLFISRTPLYEKYADIKVTNLDKNDIFFLNRIF